jgi:RHS repeat-associated protein
VAGDVLSDGFNQYQYDAEGRIASVGTAISCIYDAEGRRLGKTDGTRYIVGLGGEIIDALQGTSWQRTEVYAGGWHLATVSSAGVTFDHGDWIGTERARTSAIGELCQETSSEPFGDGAQSGTPSGAAACSPTPDFLTGKPRDSESNLDDFGARYFNSRYGQWMSPDWSGSPEAVPYASLGDPQSLNLYAYAGNDPVDGEDPDGHSIYNLGNGVYDNLSGLQQYVMDTDEARPASGNAPSVTCNSFLCSIWGVLKSNVHFGGGGGPNTSLAAIELGRLFASEPAVRAKQLHGRYPQQTRSRTSVVGVNVNTGAAIHYPDGYTYCGDFVCDASGHHAGVANDEVTGIHDSSGMIFAGAGIAWDLGAVEGGRLFGTTLDGNTPLLNNNNWLRFGWSHIRSTGGYRFRITGKLLNRTHINLWPPSWWFGPPGS